MQIQTLNEVYGRQASNRIKETNKSGLAGAIACLETFYHAFNKQDLTLFTGVWLNNAFIQLNNPLGGMVRGIGPILTLYEKIFSGQSKVWVEFADIVCYATDETVTFAGKETGQFQQGGEVISLHIRTSRFFVFSKTQQQWFQVHHHGSIDDPELLERYQNAVLNV